MARCLKRLERAGEGFRGRVMDSFRNGRTSFMFHSSEEACLAAIEMQRRVADIPSVAGIKLSLRIALLAAETEEKAVNNIGKLLELSLPNQILCSRQILLEVATNVGLRVRDLHRQLSLEDDEEPTQIMELIWHEVEEELPSTLTSTALLAQEFMTNKVEMPVSGNPVVFAQVRLRVQYGDKNLVLDEKMPFITVGREYHNDIVLDDSRISRLHARIERKSGRYYLVDMSTNGTFVMHNNNPEVFLLKDSMPLHDTGVVCFGVSTRDQAVEKLIFEHI
jgi:hypothetical protein